MLGLGDLLASRPRLTGYYARIGRHAIIGPVLQELTAAQAEYQEKYYLTMAANGPGRRNRLCDNAMAFYEFG